MFSVVIPTYNRGYSIVRTIESLLAQDYADFEIIVVDDGSTDDTKQIILSIIENNPKVKYVFQENAGASSARNLGISLSKYPYIVHMDSDDTAEVSLLKIIADYLARDKNKTFGTVNHIRHIVLQDKNGNVIEEKEPFQFTEETPTLQDYYHWKMKTTSSGIFFNKEIFAEVQWDKELRYIEDLDFLMQLGAIEPNEFVFVDEPLVYYTQSYGGDGMCSNAQYQDWADAFDAIYQKHKDDPLMVGQTWWPDRVNKYTQLQKEVDAGQHEPQLFKYFPNYSYD